MQGYKVVKAATAEEAIAKSGMRLGQLGVITEFKVSANADGTWSVFPIYQPKKEQ